MDIRTQKDNIFEKASLLTKNGKYAAALELMRNIYLYDDDELKRAVKESLEEIEQEKFVGEQCGECCGSCCSSECGSAYCLAFCGVSMCCGTDAAFSVCGIDYFCDSGTNCIIDQCCR